MDAAAPTLPAAIHVPDLAPSAEERLVAARTRLRFVVGVTLFVAAALLVAGAFAKLEALFVVVPAAWCAAFVLGALARVLPVNVAVDDRTRRRAWALLYAGIALFAPLTLHWLLFVVEDPRGSARDFSQWVKTSAMIVGHTHVVFGALLAWRGYTGTRPNGFVILGVATAVTLLDCIPFGAFGIISTLLVAVTGAFILAIVVPLRAHWGREP